MSVDLLKLTPEEFQKIAKIVYDRTGIHLEERKLSLLSNRLRKRLKALNFDTFEEYRKKLTSNEGFKEEEPHFLSAVTTNETYFFRNEQLWRYFESDLVPEFVESKGKTDKTIRVWSAASSSGEEAYTTAIMLREMLPNFSTWNVKIIGSDISSKVLDMARAGVYNAYAVSKTTPDRLKKWFDKQDEDKFALKPEIKKMVQFQFHNLRDNFMGAKFDLIFLRNVLMYFDIPMKKKVIDVVTNALQKGGRLIVGDVDPIRTIPELSEHIKLTYQRPGVYQNLIGIDKESKAKKSLVKA